MKKLIVVLLCLSVFLASCDLLDQTILRKPEQPSADAPAPEAETPVTEEPELILREGDVEVLQGTLFDPVSLIDGGQYDTIQFSSIDTSVAGEQELVITITKDGQTKEYRKRVLVIRPEVNLTYEMIQEGPVFLIHPDKLTGEPDEDQYKSYYEYPVFTSDPPGVDEKINQIIHDTHIWGVAQSFQTMSNSIAPEYGRADILQAPTVVSQDKEALAVHTTLLIAHYRSSFFGKSEIVTIFDIATGLPISSLQQVERYGLSAQDLVDRLNQFLAEQPNTVRDLDGVDAYDPGMDQDEMMEYFEDLMWLTASDDFVMLYLEEDIALSDLEGKVFFVENGKLYCEFVIFTSGESSTITSELMDLGPIE